MTTLPTQTTMVRAPFSEAQVMKLLAEVADPEIPVVNVVEIGLIRFVRGDNDGKIEVGVSPTYTGCPATEAIQGMIREKLQEAGFRDIAIKSVYSPPWTSDWITETARQKLKEFGIAPPLQPVGSLRSLLPDKHVNCPRCNSTRSERVSEFGSTPCKALYRCNACLEPFEYFKCI